MSWGWRKILQVYQIVCPFIWYKLGDGTRTSAWFDNWCSMSPLADLILNRDIYRAGFRHSAKDIDIIDASDKFIWKNFDIVEYGFSVATVWSCIRPRVDEVWEHLKRFTGMSIIPSNLSSIVDFLIPMAKIRSVRCVISKLIFAAASYFIWQERNYRLFMKKKRSEDQVIDLIKSTVRLKLLTFYGSDLGTGVGPIQVTTNEKGVETEVPPKIAQALLQRQRERKAKSILLLAILDEYQLRFHRIKDEKSLWAAIKSRFCGNVESKKMQKTVLKQQFEKKIVSDTEGLDKAYDRVKPLSSSYTDILMFSFFANQLNRAILQGIVEHQNQGTRNGDAGDRSRDKLQKDVPMATSVHWWVWTQRSICSKTRLISLEKLQKQFDEQRQTLSKANLEIIAYQLGLESVEAQLVVHQKNEAVYEEKIAVLEFKFQSDGDDNQTNDRFKKDNGYHAVPPPLTGNYMPPLADLSFAGLDDSVYRPTTNKTSASMSQVEKSTSQTSNTNVEMPRVKFVRPSGVIIEDWVSDDDEDIFQSNDFYSHLIKDYDFHEKRIAKKFVLKNIGKNSGQREIRPVWNSAQRINHQNKFVPSAVLTRSGRVPVSTAKQSSLRATTSTSTFRPVNTATHTNRVNVSKLRTNAFHKSHSPIRRPFHKSTAPNTSISIEKVNTIRVKGVNTVGQTAVSTVKGNGVTTVKASAGCVWRAKITNLNNVSKDNSGSWVSKRGNPQQALKNQGIFDIGCSRHMLGNKDFLTDYQELDGGFVAFGRSARGDNVLFTETECLVLYPDFKLLDASQVLLRVPRQSYMYNLTLTECKNVVPFGDLTCLYAKAINDESKL
ncbi:hypothetical protein Tco_0471061 [Tanacetum coccineum]